MKEKNKIKLEKILDDKRYLLVISVAIAVLLYFVVAITTNDSRTVIIRNVPVDLDLQSANLVNQGLTVIEGGDYVVDIEVNGPLTEIGGLGPDSPELLTTADVSQITEPDTYNLPLVSGYGAPLSFQIVSYRPSSISVRFDRLRTNTLEIAPIVRGLNTPPPYVLDRQYTMPDSVTITGPVDEVERVASAEVGVELSESLQSSRRFDDLEIVLRDEDGAEIDIETSHLTLSVERTSLYISVLKQTELPIEVRFVGEPRGFPTEELAASMTLSSDSLVVAGRESAVDRLTEIVAGYVDIRTLHLSDNTHTFQLELPDGIRSLDSVSTVTARFDATGWDTAYFNVSQVEIVNPPAGFDVTLVTSRVEGVEFVGLEEILETMTADDIVAEVDLSDVELSTGQRNYPVKISAPGRGLVWAVGDYTVLIQVEDPA